MCYHYELALAVVDYESASVSAAQNKNVIGRSVNFYNINIMRLYTRAKTIFVFRIGIWVGLGLGILGLGWVGLGSGIFLTSPDTDIYDGIRNG
jgi:hypothetical protein